MSARLAALSMRERWLLAGAAMVTVLVLGGTLAASVRDDLAVLRARVATHERQLVEARRAATILRRSAGRSSDDDDAASLPARLQAAAEDAVGRERIASMTPATQDLENGLAENRVTLAVTGTSLAETVGLLHALESASPPLPVARLALRKHPDDPERFDATIEVAELRRAP